MSAPTGTTVSAATTLDSYNSVRNILHYALGIAGLFGVGGAFAVGGLPAQLISIGVSSVALVAGPVLHQINVAHNSIIGEILDKVEALDNAVTSAPTTSGQ